MMMPFSPPRKPDHFERVVVAITVLCIAVDVISGLVDLARLEWLNLLSDMRWAGVTAFVVFGLYVPLQQARWERDRYRQATITLASDRLGEALREGLRDGMRKATGQGKT